MSSQDHRLNRVHVVVGRVVFSRGSSRLPIKKIGDCSDTREHFLRMGEFSAALPSALLRTVHAFAEAFSLDSGALDLVADGDRRYFVIDVNSAP
ncbi:MAG: hypothetical protein ACE141_13755 [Bryobacteraceae bacterium]